MAKTGGDNAWKILVTGVLFLGAFWYLDYMNSGEGENNSPYVPDAIENRLDRVVAALNQQFGKYWVNTALFFLQRQIELAFPGAAALVSAAHWAERNHAGQPGFIKKQAALRMLGA
jgi:hypothetical protein